VNVNTSMCWISVGHWNCHSRAELVHWHCIMDKSTRKFWESRWGPLAHWPALMDTGCHHIWTTHATVKGQNIFCAGEHLYHYHTKALWYIWHLYLEIVGSINTT
jgi:hypothetical protein